MTTSSDARCIHCDAALTARDLTEGWCDSCGKRLPGGGRPAPKAAPAAEAAAPAAGAGRSRFVVWGGIALAVLGAVAAIAAAG